MIPHGTGLVTSSRVLSLSTRFFYLFSISFISFFVMLEPPCRQLLRFTFLVGENCALGWQIGNDWVMKHRIGAE